MISLLDFFAIVALRYANFSMQLWRESKYSEMNCSYEVVLQNQTPVMNNTTT